MILFKISLILLDVLIIVACLLPFVKRDEWWIRGWDFPRLQVFILGAVLAVVSVFVFKLQNFWENALLSALILAIGYQGKKIFPYTPLAKNQVLPASSDVPAKQRISLVTANVFMENRQVEKVEEVIAAADPDVLLLVETDKWWEEHLDFFLDKYPYSVKKPMENTYGMMLFSRFELIESQVKFLIEDDVPSIHTWAASPFCERMKLFCVHPKPPAPPVEKNTNNQSTERDAELLLVGREAAKIAEPVIVMGDLNDVAWSYTTSLFQKISRLLDPRRGRGMYNSFHAHYFFLRFPLDHMFHSGHFKLVAIKTLPDIGSDHFPCYFELAYAPENIKEQEASPKDEEAEKEAQEKIEEAT